MENKQKKLRIASITFHRAINYGAILQAYALQESFKKLGCEFNVIDYRNQLIENNHKKRTLSGCRTIKDVLSFIVYAKHYNKKHNKFRDFSRNYLNTSEACFNTEDLKNITSDYDKFVCGSDQVWNYQITDFDKAYFLDFVEDKCTKYSYAASFGFSKLPGELKEEYRRLLSGFNEISVREDQGKDIVRDVVDKDVEVVIDPTMLVSKEEWAKIAKDYTKKKDYILIYAFKGSETISSFAQHLSEKTGCEIVYISHSLKRKIKAVYEKEVGPREFLGLFKNAKYVVTNSFHGTVFSINFNKNFFMELLPEKQKVNSRLENALNLFGLRDRQIINGKNSHIEESIDYDRVNKILEAERQKSVGFLNKIINS